MNDKGLGPDEGWGRCVEGDAPSFTNWREGQPDDYHGYTKRTARFSPPPTSLEQWQGSNGIICSATHQGLGSLACALAAAPRPPLPTIVGGTGGNQRLQRPRLYSGGERGYSFRRRRRHRPTSHPTAPRAGWAGAGCAAVRTRSLALGYVGVQAAAVAALVGGSATPDAALERAPRSSSAACPPAGCSPQTSPTARLRHQQGRRSTRARSRRRWGNEVTPS